MKTTSQTILIGLGSGAFGALLAVTTIGAAPKPKASRIPALIEAHEFRLTDIQGNDRGAWFVGDGATHFTLYDAQSRPRITLAVQDDGTAAITVGSIKGEGHASLYVLPSNRPVLNLRGRGNVTITPGGEEKTAIEISDQDGKQVFKAP